MQASRRWRDWNPVENLEKSAERELTKPPELILSVLSVPTLAVSEKSSESSSIHSHDPAEWRKPFARWLDSACVRNPRCFGGLSCLHLAFCEWEIARGEVPCTRVTFERMLSELGFLMGEVSGVMLVSSLTFREDFAIP